GQRRLPRAVLADEREPLARSQGEAHVPKGPPLGARILESHILEHESFADGTRDGPGVLLVDNGRLDLEEEEQVAEIEDLLIHLGRGQQESLNDIPTLRERRRQEG